MKSGLAFLALLGACATPQETPAYGTVPVTVAGSIGAGSTGQAVLRNSTTRTIYVGDLGCTASIDRQSGSEWVPTADDRVCRAFARQINVGDSLAFTFVAPAVPGHYRLRATGEIDPNPAGGGENTLVGPGTFTLESNAFEVEQP